MFEPSISDPALFMTLPRQGHVRHLPRRWRAVGAPSSVAGADQVPVTAIALEGAWTLRFGRFGCPDSETRGGVVHLERGRLFGGNANFAFDGFWELRGTELNSALLIVRHGADKALATLFGIDESEYRAECSAEVITHDLIEGRIKRAGFRDARMTMRRLPFRPR